MSSCSPSIIRIDIINEILVWTWTFIVIDISTGAGSSSNRRPEKMSTHKAIRVLRVASHTSAIISSAFSLGKFATHNAALHKHTDLSQLSEASCSASLRRFSKWENFFPFFFSHRRKFNFLLKGTFVRSLLGFQHVLFIQFAIQENLLLALIFCASRIWVEILDQTCAEVDDGESSVFKVIRISFVWWIKCFLMSNWLSFLRKVTRI